MKTKKALKLIKEVNKIFNKIILLSEINFDAEKQRMENKIKSDHHDYKLKNHNYNYEKYSDEKKENIITYILDTGEKIYLDDSQIEWNAKLLDALSNKGFIVKRPATFSEAFEKVKTEDPVLKEAYDEIEKSMPFAHPLSEDAKQDDKYFELKRIDNKLADLEITKSSILAIRILVEKGLI